MLKKVFQLFSKKDSKFVIKLQFFYFLIAVVEVLSISSIAPLTYSIFNPNIEDLNNKFSQFLFSFSFEKVIHYQIFFVSIFCFLIVLYNSLLILASSINENLVKDTCIHLYKKAITNFFRSNLKDYAKKNNSEYVNQMTFDIQNISVQVLSNFLKSNLKIYSILIIFVAIIYIDFVNAFILMIMALISYFLIFKNIKKYISKSGKSATTVNSEILRTLKEIFQNFEIISLHKNFKYVYYNTIKNITLFSNSKKNIEIIYVLARCSIEILAAFILSLLILFSISNYTLIEYLPLLTFYFFAFYRLFPNLQQFFLSYSIMNTWNYSLDKILENINYDDFDIIEKVDVEFDFKNDIKIKDLSYKRDNKIIFNNFNCEIKKNSIVGINGKSGSGKTTLVKIISGLITDYDGKIEIDTKRLKEDEISSWQKNIGYVPQYNFLLLDSIMNNIAMSTKIEDISLNYLNQSIATVELEKVFTKDQLSNSQRIGEDSVKISGGQKQRISIARALYRNPKLLILDESFNSLDFISEQKIMKNIKKNFPEMTIILISHRSQSLEICDKLIELN